jgi:hypothetical protein
MLISMSVANNQILTAKRCFELLLFTQQGRRCRIHVSPLVVPSCAKIKQSGLEKYKQSNHMCRLRKPLRRHQWADAVAHSLT